MKVSGKVIVVTGAGSGMGRELALELLHRGARVAAVDLNAEALEHTAALAASRSQSLACFTVNITDRAAVEALVQKVQERFGAVDGLINCAGIIQPFVKLIDLDVSVIERVFDVNFRGTLYMIKAFLPAFVSRPEAHIVNISSMGGFLPVPGQTAYGSSKAAVKLLTEGLHAELVGGPVHVTVVFPGAIETNILQNSGVSLPAAAMQSQQARPYPARSAARDILDGMEQNAYRVLVGKDAKLLDALYRLAPKRATLFIASKMKQLLSS
jgi:NAD(P)-dependent dehydrogenase (short-subunit alcohol dehydrogenase family)